MFAGEDDRARRVRAKVGPFGVGTSAPIPMRAVAVEGAGCVVGLL